MASAAAGSSGPTSAAPTRALGLVAFAAVNLAAFAYGCFKVSAARKRDTTKTTARGDAKRNSGNAGRVALWPLPKRLQRIRYAHPHLFDADADADAGRVVVRTVEMHTGGEPVRIVVSGFPPLHGTTLLAKRRHALHAHDHLRRRLMWEPRGHADMYGCLLVEPTHRDAHAAVLFTHNAGYSTMCGHATIALARWLADSGLLAPPDPTTGATVVRLELPCGLVTARVYPAVSAVPRALDGARASAASASAPEPAPVSARYAPGHTYFESVPCFAYALDVQVSVPGHGPNGAPLSLTVDIGYGGAFYALARAADLGLDVRKSATQALVHAGDAITRAVQQLMRVQHPNTDADARDLEFVYGTILTDDNALSKTEADAEAPATANVCIFANREVDRSATGSGVSARMAVLYARGLVRAGEQRRFQSVTGDMFTGRVVRTSQQRVVASAPADGGWTGHHLDAKVPASALPHAATVKYDDTAADAVPASAGGASIGVVRVGTVVVEVGGRAYYSGESTFVAEPDDPLRDGFLLS